MPISASVGQKPSVSDFDESSFDVSPGAFFSVDMTKIKDFREVWRLMEQEIERRYPDSTTVKKSS